jgi:hypothetical protein
MIECIFTTDYEIFGNGEGSLKELLYNPLEELGKIFKEYESQFVIFVEVAELEMIEKYKADSHIDLIKQQIKKFYNDGFEIGLHIHPWWYNAYFNKEKKWTFNYKNYNLCNFPIEKIREIINRGIYYLRNILNVLEYTPLSFRAGHLLFQPTKNLAYVLSEKGIKIDSSVYKGGMWYQQKIDYRNTITNGNYWKFKDDVTISDSNGILLEIPVHTKLVPIWKIFTSKRIGVQKMNSSIVKVGRNKLSRIRDYLRFKYPIKFDFCEMNLRELKETINEILIEDEKDPKSFKPLVAIGHTKELIDLRTVKSFLNFLYEKRIKISTFNGIYSKCI